MRGENGLYSLLYYTGAIAGYDISSILDNCVSRNGNWVCLLWKVNAEVRS